MGLLAISCYWNSSLELLRMENDKVGRILIVDIKVQSKNFLLIIPSNSNTESEQLNTISNFCKMMNNFDNISYKRIALSEDLDLFFEFKWEA